MPVDVSLKEVPDDIASRLRERARRNHRSLEGEVMEIVRAAVGRERTLSPREALERAQALGLTSVSESVDIVRAMRDGRHEGR